MAKQPRRPNRRLAPAKIDSTAQQATAFLDYLRAECHLADNTIAAYRRDLTRLKTWLAGRPVRGVTIGDLT
ncbi:MAG: site-specific integrase, partial [Planctomycetales bacterium]|nr:site-specific integrase [Planctomycetales bacterium]